MNKMEFKCSGCDYISFFKIDVKRHIEKNNKCSKEDLFIMEIPIDIECDHCNKKFKTKKYLLQHHKVCKKRGNEIERLKKELEEANKKIMSITNINNTNTNTNSNNTNITNNNTVNNNITIQLRPYNNPKIPDDIDEICYTSWIKMKSNFDYIEKMYDSFPENKNMCITNLSKALTAKVFNGKKWITKNQDKLLDEIIDVADRCLEDWIDEKIKKREYLRNMYIEYMEKQNKEKIDKDIKDTKEDLRLFLYNSFKNGQVNIKSSEVQKIQDKEESEEEPEEESEEESEKEENM